MEDTWDSEKIYFEGDHYFNDLIRDIENAKSSITIEVYMYSQDILGQKIQNSLLEARRRGVHIQIIVDGIGSHELSNDFIQRFSDNSIRVKIFNPLPFYHPLYGKHSWMRKFSITHKRAWRINKRNHRKIFVIDDSIIYTGSFNITIEHTSDYLHGAWQDLGARVTGECVRFATLNFKKNWKLRDFYRYKKFLKKNNFNFKWKTFPLRLNQNLLMRNFFNRDLLQKMREAENEIWLTTPYFIPKRKIIKLLARAAQRGVNVQILISDKSDIAFFQTLQYFYYDYLLKKGVKIYHYTNTVLHAKNFIIDNWMTLGSSNLNHRSFIHDLEVDLIVTREENRKEIRDHFLSSLHSDNQVTLETLNRRPWYHKFLGRLLFTFKYWF